MKRKFSIVLCILGVACILIGLFQVVSPSYQYYKEQYNECMELYETAKLEMQTSLFYDIRQNYADIASNVYGTALHWQSKIEQSNIICIVLCVLGGAAIAVGILLPKRTTLHNNNREKEL